MTPWSMLLGSKHSHYLGGAKVKSACDAKLAEFRKTSASSSIFIKTFWFFFVKDITNFLLFPEITLGAEIKLLSPKKIWEVLMKIEGIQAISVPDGLNQPPPPPPGILGLNSNSFQWLYLIDYTVEFSQDFFSKLNYLRG